MCFLVSSLVQQFILQKGVQWPYIEAGVNMCGSRGGTGGPDPTWKITKIKGSLAILVRIPLKSQSYQSSIHCWAIIGPPAKRHLKGVSLPAVDGPLIVVFGSFLPSPNEKNEKKTLTSWPPLTKLSGSAHD